jgi:flavin-dependent dehydrogenase
VVGGGPAGASAAIALARAGARVILLERSGYAGDRIGETFPPEVRFPLERLGVWDRFLAGGHVPSPGILAAWGGTEPRANDFILNPHGPGWTVDRRQFDGMLADAALDAGVTVWRDTRILGWTDGCLVTSVGPAVGAGVVVDATGRASRLRRDLGGRRVASDRLVALVGVVRPVAGAGDDLRALIEATEHGWWYSARLPDGRLVLAFHTDAGPGLSRSWDEFLAAAPHTAARAGGARPGRVRRVAAASQRREPAAGRGWLAVGDAAAAHDPICGLGVQWALESGLAAAAAVVAGDPQPYACAAREQFDAYLDQRVAYYRGEPRWPAAPFWQARQADIGPALPA